MLIDFKEIGYTPANLKRLLDENKLKVIDAAKLAGVTRGNFHRYLYDCTQKNHSSMAYCDWLNLIDAIEKEKEKRKNDE